MTSPERSDATGTSRPAPPFALLADRVWDGAAGTAREGLAVIVAGEHIQDVAPVGELPPLLERVELDGCTLIPGLIDAHVHFSAPMGHGLLAAGVTTIRDVGNDLDWILARRAMHKADPAAGPTVCCCGHLLDGSPAYWKAIGRPHADADALRSSIQEHVARDVDAIKLYSGLTPEVLRSGVAEAHRLGKPALAHLGATSAEHAAEAGLDEIQHLDRCDVAWRPACRDEDDRLIDILLANNVAITPTLVVWDRLGRVRDLAFAYDSRRVWVHPYHLQLWSRYPDRTRGTERRMRNQMAIPHLKRFLARAHARGVTVGLGTDTPFPHLVPGFSVHDELAMYVDAGLRPIEALRSATSTNARMLGLAPETGQLVRGRRADILAVRGDPLERIEAVAEVELVVHRGRQLTQAALLDATTELFGTIPSDAITRDLTELAERFPC